MKQLMAFLLALVLVLGLCACGAGTPEAGNGADSATTPTEEEIKVNMELVGSWASVDRDHYDKTEEGGVVTEENKYTKYSLELLEDGTYTASHLHEKVEIEKQGNTTTKTTTASVKKESGTWSMEGDVVTLVAEDGTTTVMTYAEGVLSGSETVGELTYDYTYTKQ